MVSLTDQNKSQVRFFLGYSPSSAAVDRAALEYSMSNVPDSYTVGQIDSLIVRCTEAFNAMAPGAGGLIQSESESVTGAGAKATLISRREVQQTRISAFNRETGLLAAALGVRNYRDPEDWRFALPDVQSYVNSLPGSQGDRGDKGRAGLSVLEDEDSVVLLGWAYL